VACESTAAACARAATERNGIAVAARGQAGTHGLVTVERDVGDLSGVLTRFLVVGPSGAFVENAATNDPTYRRLWLVEDDGKLEPATYVGRGARFDEIVVGPSRVALVVTTSARRPGPKAKSLALGYVPWSPRTPIVRVK
jgi:prephenate dehydratase